MAPRDERILQIGEWRVDPALDEISRAGRVVKLEPRTMRVLLMLAERAGEVLSVQDLLDRIWPEVVVTHDSVYTTIADLRRMLGDDPRAPTYIANVPRRGYRLVALVAPWVAPVPLEGASTTPQAVDSEASGRARRSGLAAAAAILLFIAAGVGLALRGSLPGTIAPGIGSAPAPDNTAVSVAVLPFVDLSERHDQEFLADGLAEELIDLLARIPNLHVPARTSSFYFKGRAATTTEIARALHATYVLEGSVRKASDRLRINVQLVRADSGYHLWSESFDRKSSDVFEIQDEIASSVVRALKISLAGEATPRSVPTQSEAAHTLYLQARSIYRRNTKADLLRAADYLEQALRLDPDFAAAWATLARVRVDTYAIFVAEPFERAHREAEFAATQALRLAPELPDSHLAMGWTRYLLEWDWQASATEAKRALALDPGSADAYRLSAFVAATQGRFAAAADFAQNAIGHDPLEIWNYNALNSAYYLAGRFKDAEAPLRTALDLNPTASSLHASLGYLLLVRGEAAAGLAEIEKEPDPAVRSAALPIALDAVGRRAEADQALADVEQRLGTSFAWQIALVHARRQDADGTFRWLERAYRQHDAGLVWFDGEPLLQTVTTDPRYVVFRRKMNLTD